jgi:membrane protein
MVRPITQRSPLRPSTWALVAIGLLRRTLARLWGRDVMLYVGGVSFFALLAGFPALAILLGIYSLMLSPQQALIQADAFAQILPPGAGALFQSELMRLAQAPIRAVSTQSAIALAIGVYAAHRGFKALMAGLSFIHDEERPHSFFSFHLLVAAALLVAFALISLTSGLFLAVRVMRVDLMISPHLGWFFSEWTWASL